MSWTTRPGAAQRICLIGQRDGECEGGLRGLGTAPGAIGWLFAKCRSQARRKEMAKCPRATGRRCVQRKNSLIRCRAQQATTARSRPTVARFWMSRKREDLVAARDSTGECRERGLRSRRERGRGRERETVTGAGARPTGWTADLLIATLSDRGRGSLLPSSQRRVTPESPTPGSACCLESETRTLVPARSRGAHRRPFPGELLQGVFRQDKILTPKSGWGTGRKK